MKKQHNTQPSRSKKEPSSAELLYLLLFFPFQELSYGVAVRIPGFHPGGPGSKWESAIFCASSDMHDRKFYSDDEWRQLTV